MSHYTPQQLRVYIDDLDAVLRTAIVEKRLKEVYEAEKHRIVRFSFFILYSAHFFLFLYPLHLL